MQRNRLLDTGITCSAFLFSFLILFSVKFANIALIVFYAFSLIAYAISRPKISKQKVRVLKMTTLLLLTPLIISLLSGLETDLILKGLGRRVAFFLTPFSFLILSEQNISNVKEKALKGLILGVAFSSSFLILNILHEYYLTRPLFTINKDLFNFYHTNYYFTRVLDIHPSYYGMFVIIGVATVYFYKGFNNFFLNTIFILLSIVVLLFLNARIILFLFLIISIIFFIKYFYNKTQNLLKVLIYTGGVLVLLAGVLFFVTKNTYAYQRVFKETLWEFSDGIDTNYNFKSSGDSRMARWDVALDVIKREPILGYGVFKEREVLQKEYVNLNMISSSKSRYNAHNQLLGYAIEGGVFSALALFLFICLNFYASIKKNDLLFFLFVLSISFICLIENYLVRNAGIVFTAFFSSIFLFAKIKE